MPMNNNFSEDLLSQILLWLPVISLSRFKCVCKSWYTFISDRTFINKHLLHTQSPSNQNKNAFVLIKRRDKISSDHVFSMISYETLQASVPQLPLPSPYSEIIDKKAEVFIVGSCNGLVCLQICKKFDDITLLWNPATKETKVIPISYVPFLPADYIAPNGYGFGFDAKTQDYKIIKNFRLYKAPTLGPDEYEYEPIFEYHSEVYSLKTDSWRQIDSYRCHIFHNYRCMRTNLNGIGTWWVVRDDIFWEGMLSFDINKEVFLETPMPDDWELEENFDRLCINYFLLNELIALAISKQTFHEESPMWWNIWLLQEYGVKESWTKLYRIGPLTGCFLPLDFWRDDITFWQTNDGELALYDPSTKQMTNLQIDGEMPSLQVITYVETLVSISGANDKE